MGLAIENPTGSQLLVGTDEPIRLAAHIAAPDQLSRVVWEASVNGAGFVQFDQQVSSTVYVSTDSVSRDDGAQNKGPDVLELRIRGTVTGNTATVRALVVDGLAHVEGVGPSQGAPTDHVEEPGEAPAVVPVPGGLSVPGPERP